jgi:hypothetical protein
VEWSDWGNAERVLGTIARVGLRPLPIARPA